MSAATGDRRGRPRSRPLAGAVALALLVAGCSGGGGGVAVRVEFTAPQAQLAESGGALELAVRLDTSGETLAQAVTVLVEDAGTGSATSALDYQLDAPMTLTFAAGSADGTLATFAVAVLADAAVEGDETVVLALAQATGGAALGAVASATVTIHDETAPGALAVTLDVGAGPEAAEAGATLAFGPQGVSGGPTGDAVLALENTGDAPVVLSTLAVEGVDAGDFTVAVDASGLPAAVLPATEEQGGPRPPRPTPLRALHAGGGEGARLVLDGERLAALIGLTSVRLEGVALPPGAGEEGATVDLDLERLPSPWSADAVVRVNGADHASARELTRELSLWRGSVVGRPGSAAYLGLSPSGTRGWVRLSDDPDDRLALVAETTAALTPGGAECRLARPAQVDPTGFASLGEFCTEQRAVPGAGPVPSGVPARAQLPAGALLPANCRVAFETDAQFLQRFPDAAAATTYVTQLLAALNEQYLEDVQAGLEGVALSLWDVSHPSEDPWETSEQLGGTPGGLLDEFEALWSPLHGAPLAPDGVAYDIAHFLSGASLGGGVAYVDVLCNANFAFGVSTNMTGAVDFAAFTGEPDHLNWDFVVVAHEIGHNFGALHTHDYCPPLDECLPNFVCNDDKVCDRGTLMSYCHLCPGGNANIDLEFHGVVANEMRLAVDGSCLESAGLAGGSRVSYRVAFDPRPSEGQAGDEPRAATLRFTHGAQNQSSPFTLELTGTATLP